MNSKIPLLTLDFLSLIILSTTFSVSPFQKRQGIYQPYQLGEVVHDGYYPAGGSGYFDVITVDLVHAVIKCGGTVNIPRNTFPIENSSLKNGQFLKKGTKIGSTSLDYNARVFEVNDDNVVLENLDLTSVSAICSLSGIALDQFVIDYKILFLNKTYEPISSKAVFSVSDFSFHIDLILDNQTGYFLNDLSVQVQTDLKIQRNGMFVKKEFVYTTEEEHYVKKLFYIKNAYYYSIIPIQIVEEFGNYYSIIGDGLKDGNYVI